MKSAPRKVDESPVAPEKAAPSVFEETRETQGSVTAGSRPRTSAAERMRHYRARLDRKAKRRHEAKDTPPPPPYIRPITSPRNHVPEGFTRVCTHCWCHSAPADPAHANAVLQKCCQCAETREGPAQVALSAWQGSWGM